MPRRSKKTEEEPVIVVVESTPLAKGEGLDVPPRPIREAGKPVHVSRPSRARTLTAAQAAARSTLVPGGGSPFAAWLRGKAIDPMQRRDPAFYDDLLAEFAARPIGGHRRRIDGTHKRNRADIR